MSRRFLILLMTCLAAVGGCGKPNKPAIELRKQNQELREEIARLQRVHEADRAALVSVRATATTVPSLDPRQLDRLFTVHGMSFGRLTGGADLDRQRPGHEGVKVYVVPTDQAGDSLKAAVAFTVEAFDLEREGEQKIGQWDFPVEQAEKNWHGKGMLYTYVLTCPWQTVPEHRTLVLQVTLQDPLSGRTFVQRREVQVEPPGGGRSN